MDQLNSFDSTDTTPWIEKYRPQTLDGIISHNHIIGVLKKFISNNKLPHMLFYGPPGTGKTSVITSCAKELYGEDYNMMVVEINASEERGIEIVRNRITRFASLKSFCKNNNLFKLIILDEADAMTLDAQASLRKVIEKYTYNVRFCLVCNYIKKINSAIQSRCVCIRFAPINDGDIKNKLTTIISNENINIDDSGVNKIIKRSKGDMRKILNILQSAHMAYSNLTINEEIIDDFLGFPNKSDIKTIFDSLIKNNFNDNFNLIKKLKNDNGYSLNDIVHEIHEYVVDNLSTFSKPEKILESLQNLEHNLTSTTSDDLHIGEFVGIFCLFR
jgi:replication factor C subunit 3/5